jgi:hypothetical protein
MLLEPILSGELELCPARVRNVSRGGIGMIVHRRFGPGTAASLELPGLGGRPCRTVPVQVVHASPAGGGRWHIGCQFGERLTPEEVQALR